MKEKIIADVAVWQTLGGGQRGYFVLSDNSSSVYTLTGWGLDTDISVNAYNVRWKRPD